MRSLLLALLALFTLLGTSPIQHVVVIIQENRSVDNIFNGLPGANTVNHCQSANGGGFIALTAASMAASSPASHAHFSYLADMYPSWSGNAGDTNLHTASNSGWMPSACQYVPQSYEQPYWTMAETYTFADEFFQTNQGPSYPAHLYLAEGTSSCNGAPIAGQARDGTESPYCVGPTPWPVSDNPGYTEDPQGLAGAGAGGCGSKTQVVNGVTTEPLVNLINPNNTTDYASQYVFPCFQQPTIFWEALQNGVTFHNFQGNGAGSGYWNSTASQEAMWCYPNAVGCASEGATYRSFITSTSGGEVATAFISALGNGGTNCANLSQITYITPDKYESDHGGLTDGSGPSYVAALVNAIGQSSCWGSTAIFVTWDDWGGMFDHVCPLNQYTTGNNSSTWWNSSASSTVCAPSRNAYEVGYRVPFIAISPYAKLAYVTHTVYEFGSILKYIEENFSLSSLGTSDANAPDFTSDIFNYGQAPTAFIPVSAPLSPLWFIATSGVAPDDSSPDDDTDFDADDRLRMHWKAPKLKDHAR